MFTIGYDPDFAPIAFRNSRGEADGEAVRLVADACGRAGVAWRFVPVALAAQATALGDGSVDALAAIAVTPQRRGTLALSPVFMETGAAWFAPLAPRAAFDPDTAGREARVATPAGGPLGEVIASRWPHLRVLPAADYPGALRHVVEGGAVAAALNWHAGRAICEARFPRYFRLPEAPFEKIGLALAARKQPQNGDFERICDALGPNRHALGT